MPNQSVSKGASFRVVGPFKVPVQKGPGGKYFGTDVRAIFFEQCPGLATARGCYVFAIQKGKGIRPFYTGQASKTFQQELFTPDKKAKYLTCMAREGNGSPKIFLLVLPTKKGKPNQKAIDELETYLIGQAQAVNLDILNIKGLNRQKWEIQGVSPVRPGKPSHAVQSFRRMLSI